MRTMSMYSINGTELGDEILQEPYPIHHTPGKSLNDEYLSDISDSVTSENDIDIDEKLSPVQKFDMYCEHSAIVYRLYAANHALDALKYGGIELAKSSILPKISFLVSDHEIVVRSIIVKRLLQIAQYYVSLIESSTEEKTILINIFIEYLFPFCFQLMNDKETLDISLSCAVSMCIGVSKDIFVRNFLPLFELESSYHEDKCLSIVKILSALASHVDKEIISSHFVTNVDILSHHNVHRLREAAIELIASLCPYLSPMEIERDLLHIYARLCDDSLWNIRRMASKNLNVISQYVSQEKRESEISPIFRSLMNDVSRFVRQALTESSGRIIHTFKGSECIPEFMIEYYLDAVPCHVNTLFHTQETEQTACACAFTFPAVMDALGESSWTRLRPYFKCFAQNDKWKIRKPIAYGLSAIGSLLSKSAVENDLIPMFNFYLKDLDDVKAGILSCYARFLLLLPRSISQDLLKSTIIDIIHEDVTKPWRFRASISEQMWLLVTLFDTASATISSLLPVLMTLICDSVAEVRQKTVPGFLHLLNAISSMEKDEKCLLPVFYEIATLATFSNYRIRQEHIHVCDFLYINGDQTIMNLTRNVLFDKTISLKNDPVTDVRLEFQRSFISSKV